ncbi:MAG TPA: hypothetical protein VMH80_03460 [Bryobacteraceae bacterium]|nr:hypothetical protein [Bryobacteraceae bacterium]
MKRGTPRHPKVGHLCELLNVKLPTVVGYLELLWHFTAEFAPQGNVGKYSDKRIEAAVYWSGPAGKLIEALLEAHFLDRDPIHRLVVHDWHDHADDAVRKRLNRAGLPFLSHSPKVTGQRQTSADNGSLPEPEPEPCQSRAMPGPAAAVSTVSSRDSDPTAPPPRYPNSLALVRTRWPEADEGLIDQIAERSGCHDDALLELAIRTVHKSTAGRQHSQGLFVVTVPPIVEELRRQGLIPRNGAA